MKLDLENPKVQELAVAGVFFGIFFCFAITGLILYLTQDKKLKDKNQWTQIQENFKKELLEIKLPPKTAISKSANNSKQNHFISVKNTYFTEIEDEEFINHMSQQLKNKGWNYREKSSGDYVFYKGKFKASLSFSGRENLFGGGGKYYTLSFSLGL